TASPVGVSFMQRELGNATQVHCPSGADMGSPQPPGGGLPMPPPPEPPLPPEPPPLPPAPPLLEPGLSAPHAATKEQSESRSRFPSRMGGPPSYLRRNLVRLRSRFKLIRGKLPT